MTKSRIKDKDIKNITKIILTKHFEPEKLHNSSNNPHTIIEYIEQSKGLPPLEERYKYKDKDIGLTRETRAV